MSTRSSKPKDSSHAGSMGNLSEDELRDLTERSKYCYDLVNSWISNNDNKVSVSCAVLTVAFGVISYLSGKSVSCDYAPTNSWCVTVHTICFLLSFIVISISIILFSLAIIPNLSSNDKLKKCPIFFGDIASLPEDEYKKKVIRATTTDFIDELMHETHLNAGICLRKMCLFRTGMVFSFIANGLAILSFVAHIFMY